MSYKESELHVQVDSRNSRASRCGSGVRFSESVLSTRWSIQTLKLGVTKGSGKQWGCKDRQMA